MQYRTIVTVSDAVKMRTQHAGAANRTKRKLFSSFIEMTQNIIHYSIDAYRKNDPTDFDNEVRHGSICIATEAGRYYLHCANPVRGDIALNSLFDGVNEKVASGTPVVLNWYHNEDDDTIYEFGQEPCEDFPALTFQDYAMQTDD